MKTSEFAKLCKVSVRTLHYYDQINLLKPSKVLDNGYREYEQNQAYIIDSIRLLECGGYTLKEIKEILNEELLIPRLNDVVERINNKINDLEKVKKYIKRKIYLSEINIESENKHISFRYDLQEVKDLNTHLFSFMNDGVFTGFVFNKDSTISLFNLNEDGEYAFDGVIYEFYIELDDNEENLYEKIINELKNRFINNYDLIFVESIPKYLNQNIKRSYKVMTKIN